MVRLLNCRLFLWSLSLVKSCRYVPSLLLTTTPTTSSPHVTWRTGSKASCGTIWTRGLGIAQLSTCSRFGRTRRVACSGIDLLVNRVWTSLTGIHHSLCHHTEKFRIWAQSKAVFVGLLSGGGGRGVLIIGRDFAFIYFLFAYKNTTRQNSLNVTKWDTKQVVHSFNGHHDFEH